LGAINKNGLGYRDGIAARLFLLTTGATADNKSAFVSHSGALWAAQERASTKPSVKKERAIVGSDSGPSFAKIEWIVELKAVQRGVVQVLESDNFELTEPRLLEPIDHRAFDPTPLATLCDMGMCLSMRLGVRPLAI
jgi:hypothetical protein